MWNYGAGYARNLIDSATAEIKFPPRRMTTAIAVHSTFQIPNSTLPLKMGVTK